MATAACAAVAGPVSGPHGFLSAILGGLVSFLACLAYGVAATSGQVTTGRPEDVGGALIGALKAWAIKIVLMILLGGLVLATYRNVVGVAFVGTFVLTAVLFSAAALVRDEGRSG